MEKKFHINIHGVPALCTAKFFCPYGSKHEHFSNEKDAYAHADIINEKRAKALDDHEGMSIEDSTEDEINDTFVDFKERTLKDVVDTEELDKIRTQAIVEIKSFEEKIKEFKKREEQFDFWVKMYKGYHRGEIYWCIKGTPEKMKSMADYLDEGETFYNPSDPIDPEIYNFIKKNISQRVYYNDRSRFPRDEKYIKYKNFIRKILRKKELTTDYETIFDDNVKCDRQDYPDVVSTNLLLREVEYKKGLKVPGAIVERIPLSKKECKRLGVLAPGDNLFDMMSSTPKESYLTRKIGFNITACRELPNLAMKKLNEMGVEKYNYNLLILRRNKYKKLVAEIDSIKNNEND